MHAPKVLKHSLNGAINSAILPAGFDRPAARAAARALRWLALSLSDRLVVTLGMEAPLHERTYGPVGVRIVWGNANYGGAMPTGGTEIPAGYTAALQSLIDSGIAEVDSSRVYRQGMAEEWLGQALASLPSEQQQRLSVSTKAAPQVGPLSYDGVRDQAARSMELLLGISQVRRATHVCPACR